MHRGAATKKPRALRAAIAAALLLGTLTASGGANSAVADEIPTPPPPARGGAIVSGPVEVPHPGVRQVAVPPLAPPAETVPPTAVPEAPASIDEPSRLASATDQMAVLIGQARVNAGLLPLARSAQLDRAATLHAEDMAALHYMDHTAMDGSSPQARAAREGYEVPAGTGWLVIETISAISDAPEGALGWWLSDGVHRRVVLRGNWREVGVGYAAGGPYGRFWVALFGCRPNVLPPVLLNGMLSIPDESCGRGGDAFGSVQAVRVAETAAALGEREWVPYAEGANAHQPWPAGTPAYVQVRDASGRELGPLSATDLNTPISAETPAS